MKIFKTTDQAEHSLNSKNRYYLNSLCPFNSDNFCGNWCALFFLQFEEALPKFVILGCKGTDKRLYLE